LKRLVKYTTFRTLCKPFNYGLLVRILNKRGIDYDRALGNAAHSFGASEFFTQIRRQPSTPLLRMLRRRINNFDRDGEARLRRRTMRGHQLSQAIDVGMMVGSENTSHTYWVMPLLVVNREAVLTKLRAAGFDATARSSLIVVPTANGSSPEESPIAPWLAETIFVPGGEDMPDDEWERLIAILREVAFRVPSRSGASLSELCGVSVPS